MKDNEIEKQEKMIKKLKRIRLKLLEIGMIISGIMNFILLILYICALILRIDISNEFYIIFYSIIAIFWFFWLLWIYFEIKEGE